MGGVIRARGEVVNMFTTFFSTNRPYHMTMAAAASKQGIILGRLWKALFLSRSKRLKENKKLMKRPKRAKKKKKKKRKISLRFSGKSNGLSSGC